MRKWAIVAAILVFAIAGALLILPEIDNAITFPFEEDAIIISDSTQVTDHAESLLTLTDKDYIEIDEATTVLEKSDTNQDDELHLLSSSDQDNEKGLYQPIKLWDSGKKVKEIQRLLNKFGYAISEDGNFGPQTEVVVKDFQSHVQLEPTGIVDEATFSKLQSMEATNLAASYLAALEEKKRLEEQEAKEREVFIPVNTIMQNPELPNGCEITSLTSILNYYGYNVSKTTMADHYLPKKPFTYEADKRFGPDPYEYYVGDPRQQPGGWYSYAPPIVSAANRYLGEQGSDKKAYNISGSTKEEIMDYLHNGIPVVMWITLDLSAPKVNSHWYLEDSGEYYAATTNLHVVVLNGIVGDRVHVMNPLQGQITYNADAFFNSYAQMGQHGLVVY